MSSLTNDRPAGAVVEAAACETIAENRLARSVARGLHAAAQPVSMLQCILEVSLLSEQSPEQYRQVIEEALEQVASLTNRLGYVRELARGYEPKHQKTFDLVPLLHSVNEDLRPLFEANSTGIFSETAAESCRLTGNPNVLRNGIYAVGSALLKLQGDLLVLLKNESDHATVLEFRAQARTGNQQQGFENAIRDAIDLIESALFCSGGSVTWEEESSRVMVRFRTVGAA
jgi:hypothetical protein